MGDIIPLNEAAEAFEHIRVTIRPSDVRGMTQVQMMDLRNGIAGRFDLPVDAVGELLESKTGPENGAA